MDPIVAGLFGLITAGLFIGLGLKFFSKGLDGTYSLVHTQTILWTGVILGSYLSMAVLKGGFLGEINTNLLALMGVSAGSLVASKGIRAMQQSNDKFVINIDPVTKGLFSEEKDPMKLSIAKLQMFAWTAITITIFVGTVASRLLSNIAELPDVGSGLLILMGISSAAYVGNKISDKPNVKDFTTRQAYTKVIAQEPSKVAKS